MVREDRSWAVSSRKGRREQISNLCFGLMGLTLISVSMIEKSVDWPPTVPLYCCCTPFLPPYTTVLTPSSFAIVTWMYPSRKVARAKKYDIRTLNNAHELAHLPLLMMTIFLGSNNASLGVGEVKLSGWHSSPSLQGHWALGSVQIWWRLTVDWKHPYDHWFPSGPVEATSYHLQGKTCRSHLSIVGGCRVTEGRDRDLDDRRAVAQSLEREFHHELWCLNQPEEQW